MNKNGLLIFIGESFRLGGQGTRNRGSSESYEGQMAACSSHIKYIEHILTKVKSISVAIGTYTTPYDKDLIELYKKYLIGSIILEKPIGINNLFHTILKNIKNIDVYDFIYYIRIDLFLKEKMFNIFNPDLNTIHFPTICWYKDSKCIRIRHPDINKLLSYIPTICQYDERIYISHPRVNHILIFIPKKYYKYFDYVYIEHDLWYDLIETCKLTYDDLDVMINTYHDSDSAKDWNPLYYIVNRSQTNIWHSDGYIFNKIKIDSL